VRRTVTGLVPSIVLLAGCLAAPGPSGPPRPELTPEGPSQPPLASPSSMATPSVAASLVASVEPTTEPEPTLAPFPADIASAAVPDAIATFAWAGMHGALLYGGVLGHGPTIRASVGELFGYPNPVTAGGLIVVAEEAGANTQRLRVWRGTDGAQVGDFLSSGSYATIAADPDRQLVYTAAQQPAGGVEIRRRTFDGATNDVLLTLDKRFTPDAIPTERYGLTLDPDGVLVVEACGDDDGCRLWEVPPDAAKAPKPRTLPGHPPIVCQVVAADRDWIVVQDDAACWADTGEASLPVRAIRRSDGVSHLVTEDHVQVGRIVRVDAKTWLIGANDFVMGASVDIVRYDIVTGARLTLATDVPPGVPDQTIAVSPTVLPGSWVLLQPVFVPETGLPGSSARLLDLATGNSIALPVGTFGWS